MEPEDILFEQGSNNTPGLALQQVMYAEVEDIASMPCGCDNPTPAGFAQSATIIDNIVMKNGKQFSRLYFTEETAEVMDEVIGETDGKAVKNTLKFFHPGESAQILGFTGYAKNRKGFVFLVKDRDCNVRVFGNTCNPAKLVTAPGGTKAKAGDRKGREFTFEYTDSIPAPYFNGHVDLTGTGYASGSSTDFQTLFVN